MYVDIAHVYSPPSYMYVNLVHIHLVHVHVAHLHIYVGITNIHSNCSTVDDEFHSQL